MRRLFATLLTLSILIPSPLFAAESEIVAPPSITLKDHVRGRRNAVITLVVYSDFECPFCKTHHETMRKILRAYRGKVNLIFRHFPLPFHESAKPAAQAAECVAKIRGTTAFWTFVDRIFEQGADTYAQVGADASGNAAKFRSCMERGETTALIDGQIQGATKAGVSGTPTTYLIDRRSRTITQMVGAQPLESFRTAIDALLKE